MEAGVFVRGYDRLGIVVQQMPMDQPSWFTKHLEGTAKLAEDGWCNIQYDVALPACLGCGLSGSLFDLCSERSAQMLRPTGRSLLLPQAGQGGVTGVHGR